jgi:hypothetical protein
VGGQDRQGGHDDITHGRRVMPGAGQVAQERRPGHPLDHGDDRRSVARAGDEVAFPVAGLDPPEGRRRALGDRVDAGERSRAAGLGMAARQAPAAAEVQDPAGQLPRQATEIGTVDGLVDRLGTQPARRLIREPAAQAAGDLLGAPARQQPVRDPATQRFVPGEAAGPVQAAASEGSPVGLEGAVSAGRVDAAAELAADG